MGPADDGRNDPVKNAGIEDRRTARPDKAADQIRKRFQARHALFGLLLMALRDTAALDRYGTADLKICYDVANAHFIGEYPVEGLKAVSSHLALVHLADTTRQTFRHDAIGEGALDFEVLPDALAAVGHEERPILEIISRNPVRDFPRSVAALKNYGF